MYIGLIIIWAVLNTFALQLIAFLSIISVWWQVSYAFSLFSFLDFPPISCIELIPCFPCNFQALMQQNMQVIGGLVVIIMLPLVAQPTQPASYVFTHFETAPESTGVSSKPYAVILSVLLSNYCLYGYDTAAHLTEETKGADRTGPIAILSSIGIISFFGWAYNLALTFSIQVRYPFKMDFQFSYHLFKKDSIT